LVAAAKFLVAATKILFVVPNFVAVPKPFFPCERSDNEERSKAQQPNLCLVTKPRQRGCNLQCS